MGDVRREADRCQVGPSGPTGPTGSGVSERDTARAALVSASRAGAKTDRRSAGPARPRRKQSKAKQAGEERRGETRQTGSWLEAGRGRKRPNNQSWVPLNPSAGWTHPQPRPWTAGQFLRLLFSGSITIVSVSLAFQIFFWTV